MYSATFLNPSACLPTRISLATLVNRSVLSLSLFLRFSLSPPPLSLSLQLQVPDQVKLCSSFENLICMESCQHAQLQA